MTEKEFKETGELRVILDDSEEPGEVRSSNSEALPPNAPIGRPHIVARGGSYKALKDIGLCDGVAATLWMHDQKAFRAFFNLKIPHFEFLNKRLAGSTWASHAIVRSNHEVFVGTFFHYDDKLDWDNFIKATITITTSGSNKGKWSPAFGVVAGLSNVQPGQSVFDAVSNIVSGNVMPKTTQGRIYDREHVTRIGKIIAEYFLRSKAWEEGDYRKITWKAY